MSGPLANGSVNTVTRKMVSHTITGLKRWSCIRRDLPPVSEIKALHVYDFDNTLFMSPLPNPKLWGGNSVGFLQNQDGFLNGGWWHDHHILEATGEGIEKEEPRAWEGWWNEQLVDLVNLSIKQKDALTVLLTGRAESNFAHIIKKMVASKHLDFDLICLKPKAGPSNQIFTTTMLYKQALLKDLIHTYKDADEIRVYEDRVRHTEGFRRFFENLNKLLLSSAAPVPRKPITAEVIQVAEILTYLDPVIETAEVQRMINSHNTALRSGTPSHSGRLELRRTVFFTAYLISPADTVKLLSLISLPSGISENDIRFLGNSILITPRPCPPSLLDKVGGIGGKQTWQVTGTAVLESKIWAARVAPVPHTSSYYTDTSVPVVVLALRRDARPIDAGRIQNWQPVPPEKQYSFQTTVGEKVQLKIERNADEEAEAENHPPNKHLKRRHPGLEDAQQERDYYRPIPQQNHRGNYINEENRRPGPGGGGNNYRGGNQNRGRGGGNGGQQRYPPHASGRGGRNGGGRGGGGNRSRGRGGYKSLDDVGPGNGRYGGQGSAYQSGQQQPNYDDGPSYGGDAYKSAYPPLAGGGGGGGGLPYGK